MAEGTVAETYPQVQTDAQELEDKRTRNTKAVPADGQDPTETVQGKVGGDDLLAKTP